MGLGDLVVRGPSMDMEIPDLSEGSLADAVSSVAEFLMQLLERHSVGLKSSPAVVISIRRSIDGYLRSMAYFQGYYGERVRQNVDFSVDLDKNDPSILCMTLVPKTDLGREAIDELLQRNNETSAG